MKNQILFFGLKDDLLPVLAAVEQGSPIKYVAMRKLHEPIVESFDRGEEIPNLGKATAGSAINSQAYLIAERSVPIKLRSIKARETDEFFRVDQLLNPDTVTFTPAGMWNEEIVLHGRVATVSESEPSQELLKRFSSAFKRGQFRRVKAFLVGPAALMLLNAGKRLTISAQSPREFDLTTEP
jgi:hypothetical protein